MSWIDVPPRPSSYAAAKYAPPPVTLSCAAAKRLYLVVRPSARIEWLKPGALVSVQHGEAADAGRLRIVPNGLHLVKKTGGKISKNIAAMLVLPLLPGMAALGHKPQAVEFVGGARFLDIVLPVWAGGKPKPFSSIANSVPLIDPARAAARGRAIG